MDEALEIDVDAGGEFIQVTSRSVFTSAPSSPLQLLLPPLETPQSRAVRVKSLLLIRKPRYIYFMSV